METFLISVVVILLLYSFFRKPYPENSINDFPESPVEDEEWEEIAIEMKTGNIYPADYFENVNKKK